MRKLIFLHLILTGTLLLLHNLPTLEGTAAGVTLAGAVLSPALLGALGLASAVGIGFAIKKKLNDNDYSIGLSYGNSDEYIEDYTSYGRGYGSYGMGYGGYGGGQNSYGGGHIGNGGHNTYGGGHNSYGGSNSYGSGYNSYGGSYYNNGGSYGSKSENHGGYGNKGSYGGGKGSYESSKGKNKGHGGSKGKNFVFYITKNNKNNKGYGQTYYPMPSYGYSYGTSGYGSTGYGNKGYGNSVHNKGYYPTATSPAGGLHPKGTNFPDGDFPSGGSPFGPSPLKKAPTQSSLHFGSSHHKTTAHEHKGYGYSEFSNGIYPKAPSLGGSPHPRVNNFPTGDFPPGRQPFGPSPVKDASSITSSSASNFFSSTISPSSSTSSLHSSSPSLSSSSFPSSLSTNSSLSSTSSSSSSISSSSSLPYFPQYPPYFSTSFVSLSQRNPKQEKSTTGEPDKHVSPSRKRRSYLLPNEDTNKEVSFETLLKVAASEETLHCTQLLLCVLASSPPSYLAEEERALLEAIRLHKKSSYTLWLQTAVNRGTRYRQASVCQLTYRECPMNSNQLIAEMRAGIRNAQKQLK